VQKLITEAESQNRNIRYQKRELELQKDEQKRQALIKELTDKLTLRAKLFQDIEKDKASQKRLEVAYETLLTDHKESERWRQAGISLPWVNPGDFDRATEWWGQKKEAEAAEETARKAARIKEKVDKEDETKRMREMFEADLRVQRLNQMYIDVKTGEKQVAELAVHYGFDPPPPLKNPDIEAGVNYEQDKRLSDMLTAQIVLLKKKVAAFGELEIGDQQRKELLFRAVPGWLYLTGL
jgi:hypothetical protein